MTHGQVRIGKISTETITYGFVPPDQVFVLFSVDHNIVIFVQSQCHHRWYMKIRLLTVGHAFVRADRSGFALREVLPLCLYQSEGASQP